MNYHQYMKTYSTTYNAALFLLFFLIGCADSDNSLIEKPFEMQAISAQEKIKRALEPEYLEKLGISVEDQDYLKTVYKGRNFKPLWINDSTISDLGLKMKVTMKRPEQLGVPAKRHNYLLSKNFIQDEIANTLIFAKVVNDLKTGVIDYETKKKRTVAGVDPSFFSTNFNFDISKDIRLQFTQFSVKDSSYTVLAKGLIDMMDKYPMDEATFKIKSVKYDSTKSIQLATQALISKGYLEEGKDTTAMLESLKEFQQQCGLKPDGVVGKYTSIALNESTVHRRDRIILAMDKIRSRKPFPGKYIHINIPEYKLRFYINDSLKSDHNIVVGRDENRTPELTSQLNKIVAYPYWHVPYSISSKEILPAAKMNPGYFARHNYKIYRKDEEVDPMTVNWKGISESSFPYKVVQDPGRSNSLGIIKFDFPNKYSVYFHDTPSKSLFGADVRAYSHGCMRTQNPIDLATRILERDEMGRKVNDVMIPDSLDSIMARGKNYTIRLLDPIPIFVEYITVVREKERMVTHIDIYGRDEEYLKIMMD